MGKFRFNKEKLEFIEVRRGVAWWLKKAVKYVVVSLLLAILYYLIISLFYSTEYERRLENENRLMRKEYELMQEKLEVLDNTVANLKIKDREIYRSIFNADPPDLDELLNANSILEDIDTTHTNRLAHLSAEAIEMAEHNADDAVATMLAITGSVASQGRGICSIPSIVPLKDFSLGQSGASVGNKIHPFYKTIVEHTGMDLLAAVGSDVVATADGIVELVRRSSRESGNIVILNHENGYKTFYSHLNDILVRKGERVKQGSVIARVGNTGISFAPHLHYEIRLNDKVVDPVNYFFATLTHEQYFSMLTIASNTGQSLD